MTAEGHEKEQDMYLRRLGDRSKKAESEARDALVALSECNKQKHKLILLAMLITLVCIILSATISYSIYGH